MGRKLAFLTIVGGLLSSPAIANAMTTGPNPGAPGARVDDLLAKHHRADAPGCSVGVVRNGKLAHAGAFGMANLELNVPNTADTAFDIGSTSKQFTAASVLLLEQQGRLSLDDDIRKYLPELPDYGQLITIRHLLNHTAGIRDYLGLLRLAGYHTDDVTTGSDALSLLALQKGTHFAPGTEYQYSNSGYFLASEIVERVSGQPFREFVRQWIFEPLAMSRSSVRDDHTRMVANRATGYSRNEAQGWAIDVSNWEQVGDGAVFTTVGDLARWTENFDSGRVGGPALLQKLTARGRLADGTALDYGYGLLHGSYRGFDTIEHGGTWGGYVSNLKIYPAAKLAVAMLCNSTDVPLNALIDQVADIYLRPSPDAARTAAVRHPTVDASERELMSWAGTYRPLHGGQVATVRRDDNRLTLDYKDEAHLLRPIGNHSFQIDGPPVELLIKFRPSAVAAPRTFSAVMNGKTMETLRAFTVDPPSESSRAAVRGAYRCPELAATFTIRGDEALQLARPRKKPVALQSLESGVFRAVDPTMGGDREMLLAFNPVQAGKSPGFRLDGSRVRGLQCSRVE